MIAMRSQIRQARQTDIAQYLIAHGVALIRDGSRWRHPDHDSLLFKGNSYFWNSRQESGNAIDYLVRHMGMDFRRAVGELINSPIINESDYPIITDMIIPDLSKDMRRAIAYLVQTRGVSTDLVQLLINKKLIMQTAERNNILFPWRDDSGEIVGGETCGTLSDIRFKGILPGSKYGHGYVVRLSQESDKAGVIYFFESGIDLISYIDLMRARKKNIYNCTFVSMSGLKIEVVLSYSRKFDPQRIILCIDNDSAADAFFKAVQGKIEGVIRHSPPENVKDWNDFLKKELKHREASI